jgi:hypothetical protein
MADVGPHKPKGLTYRVDLPGGQERLAEAILYVSEKCRSAERFGLIKLNKIIWRADFSAFQARRVPVTGRAYQRLRFGPAPIEMRPLLNEMQDSGSIEIERVDLGEGKVEQRVVGNIPPHSRFFSPDDLEFLDQAIEYYWDKTGMESSDDSHGIAWKTHEDGDPLPYELVFLSDRELEPEQVKKFAAMAKERRWVSH